VKIIIKYIFILILASSATFASEYSFRKYSHVKNFYEPLLEKTIQICLQNNIPPAAVLAIAGVESGYGRGYIAKITGNILSLGANKNDAMLPPVTLPSYKGEVLILKSDIKKYSDTSKWKKRAPSLKKDYRPNTYAGSTKNLDYFLLHPNKKIEANFKCIEDFAIKWINEKSRFTPFREARQKMNTIVKNGGKGTLLNEQVSIEFIKTIGGRKNSFNYRKTWPKKVIKVMNKTGLIELAKSIYIDRKNFNDVW